MAEAEGTPKFSVVVPIYRVEAYLEECVASIQGQTLENIEIVLVDDGSPDRCGQIADALAESDSRIRVVHRENGGLGPARNSGVEASCGEYVGFVDSDDWVDPEMFEALAAELDRTGADICYSGIRAVHAGAVSSVTENRFAGRVLRGPDEIFEMRRSFYGDSIDRVRDDGVPVSVCVAGYRRELLNANDVRFEAVRSEDILFNAKAAAHASSVAVIDGVFYNYRHDEQPSITRTFKDKTFNDFEVFFGRLLAHAEAEDARFRDECLLRSRKRIVDYARALGTIICESPAEWGVMRARLLRSATLPHVEWALSGFPAGRLTRKQQLYYYALKCRSPFAMWLLQRLRGHTC